MRKKKWDKGKNAFFIYNGNCKSFSISFLYGNIFHVPLAPPHEAQSETDIKIFQILRCTRERGWL